MKLPPLPVRIVILLVLGSLAIWYKLSLVPRVALPVGRRAPAFIGGVGDWLNSSPLTWEKLRGKVVLLQFWEYTCNNCKPTHPYLNSWYRRYAQQGLVIIGIHSPEYASSARRENVVKAVAREGIRYPVLNDPRLANWRAYQQDYWPAEYLFDPAGKLVYSHAGEGAYAETEGRIQRLLHTLHAQAQLPPILDTTGKQQAAGGVCSLSGKGCDK